MRSLALVLIVAFGVIALKIVNLVDAIAVRRMVVDTDKTNRRRSNPLQGIVRSWLAPTGVMAVFVLLSNVSNLDFQSLFTSGQNHDRTPTASSKRVSPNTDKPLRTTVLVANAEQAANLPSWIGEGNKTIDDGKRLVLSSQLWSTEAEARNELTELAAAKVRTDFEERHQSLFEKAGHRFLNNERVTNAVVKHQFVEHVVQDFGKFSAPMNRLWWQIEISPEVRTELYPAWKSAVIGNRAIAVGAVLAAIALFANSASLFFRLRTEPGRNSIFASTIVATSAAAWIATDLFVAKYLCQ